MELSKLALFDFQVYKTLRAWLNDIVLLQRKINLLSKNKTPTPEIENKGLRDLKARKNIKYSGPISSFKDKETENLGRLDDLPKTV